MRRALPFDVVLPGMADDGHTASLFPGYIHLEGELVVPVAGAPKPPPERVSLTVPALANCRKLIILVTGAGKRQALQRWRAGDDIPIARIETRDRSVLLIDREAYG